MAGHGYLSRKAVRRISRAVASYEQGDRDLSAVGVQRGGGDDEPLRLCKTTAAWPKGQLATLEVWEDGTPPDESQTTGLTIPDVVNKMYPVAAGAFVMIAQAANGYWYLVEAESKKDGSCDSPNISGHDLTTLPGYSSSKKQALTHDNGCLQWVDIEDCPEGTGG